MDKYIAHLYLSLSMPVYLSVSDINLQSINLNMIDYLDIFMVNTLLFFCSNFITTWTEF